MRAHRAAARYPRRGRRDRRISAQPPRPMPDADANLKPREASRACGRWPPLAARRATRGRTSRVSGRALRSLPRGRASQQRAAAAGWQDVAAAPAGPSSPVAAAAAPPPYLSSDVALEQRPGPKNQPALLGGSALIVASSRVGIPLHCRVCTGQPALTARCALDHLSICRCRLFNRRSPVFRSFLVMSPLKFLREDTPGRTTRALQALRLCAGPGAN